MSGNYQIPFNEKGLMDYCRLGSGVAYKGITWMDNFEFDGEATVVGFSRGRSAAHFRLKVEPESSLFKDFEATMFLTDIMLALQKGVHPGAVIKGTFTFVKRGQNYGVKLVD